jgi:coatomer protein complex subunit alpha (xenin)
MIEIRDLSNSITKTIKPPVQTNDIFYGGTASLLLSSPTAVLLYDIQQQKVLAEIATPPVKYVVWSTDGMLVALLSKHSWCSSYIIWDSVLTIFPQPSL